MASCEIVTCADRRAGGEFEDARAELLTVANQVLPVAVTQRLSLESARLAAALELDEAPKLPEFSEMLLAPKG